MKRECKSLKLGLRLTAVILVSMVLTACAKFYYLDLPDIEIEEPNDLEYRLIAFREGAEQYHNDPRAVADVALRRYLDLPWKAEPFRPKAYIVDRNEKWGIFVTRGYLYPSGHLMRYRVKVKRYQEIWYATMVSRFKKHRVPDDDHNLHQH